MNGNQTYQAPQALSFGGHIRRWLFPYRNQWWEQRLQFTEKGKYGVTTETHVFFDWKDRLRILFGGILVVEVRTNSEHNPGKSESLASINILPPKSISGPRKF